LQYIRVDERDNVAIVLDPEGYTSPREHIPQSNKIALKDFEPNEPVLRYGHIIGHAVEAIPEGAWIRPDMLHMPEPPPLDRLPLSTAVPEPLPPLEGYTFEGYRNATAR
jgi:galactarate dehydratase